ncbi:MAG TPA: hypothetical protein VF407_21380 [Polyangiaceae bacterium]
MNRSNRTIALAAILATFASAYGCSSSSSSDGASPDGAQDGDAGTTGDDGGSGSEPAKEYTGEIEILPTGVSAYFIKTPPDGSCVTRSGNCTLTHCANDPDAGLPRYLAGGDITLKGGTTKSPIVLHYEPDGGAYRSSTFATPIFEGGDTFEVSGAGSDSIASFSGSSGIAPGAVHVTAPTGTGATTSLVYAFDTTEDLDVTWTGGVSGSKVQTFMTSAADPDHPIYLSCVFDAESGTGTIPASLLAELGSPPSGKGQFEVIPTSQTVVEGDNVHVNVVLYDDIASYGSWTKK